MKKTQQEIERDEQLKKLLIELQHKKDIGNVCNEELALLDLLILRLDSPIRSKALESSCLKKLLIFLKKDVLNRRLIVVRKKS